MHVKLIQEVVESVGVNNQAIQMILIFVPKETVYSMFGLDAERVLALCDVDLLDQLHPVVSSANIENQTRNNNPNR